MADIWPKVAQGKMTKRSGDIKRLTWGKRNLLIRERWSGRSGRTDKLTIRTNEKLKKACWIMIRRERLAYSTEIQIVTEDVVTSRLIYTNRWWQHQHTFLGFVRQILPMWKTVYTEIWKPAKSISDHKYSKRPSDEVKLIDQMKLVAKDESQSCLSVNAKTPKIWQKYSPQGTVPCHSIFKITVNLIPIEILLGLPFKSSNQHFGKISLDHFYQANTNFINSN